MKVTKQELRRIIKEVAAQGAVYAYVEIPGEGGVIVEGANAAEARREGELYGEVVAIFTANIIEGEL